MRTSSPSCTRSEVSEEESINPHVSESERRELFSESEEESSDSEEEVGPPTKRKFTPHQDTIDFRSVTEKPLKNDRRKMIASKFPLPSCDPAHPPKMDDAVACLIPKSGKTFDRFLSKLQQFTMDAVGPLTVLYEQLEREGESSSTVDTS